MPEHTDTQEHAFARLEQGAERLEQTAQSASDAMHHLMSFRARIIENVDEQRLQLGGRVRRLGTALQQSCDQMTQEDRLAQQLLDDVSGRLRRAASYIESAGTPDVAQDLRALARRQPAAFFGGAFLLGLALGRLARRPSTSEFVGDAS